MLYVILVILIITLVIMKYILLCVCHMKKTCRNNILNIYTDIVKIYTTNEV